MHKNRPETRHWIRPWLAVAAIAAITTGIYWNVLHGDFVFDDKLVVLGDARIRDPLDSAWRLFFPTAGEATHRPLRTFTYLIDYHLGGLDPVAFHASNLLYHILASVTVLALVARLTGSPTASAAAAIVFAVHPVQTDAVSYISGRRDVLCGLFFFLSVFSYVSYRDKRGKAWLVTALVCEALALMAKEMAATLPAIFLLMDLWRDKQPTGFKTALSIIRRNGRAYAAALLVAALCLFTYYRGTIAPELSETPWYGGSISGNFATSARIWSHYLRLLIYPSQLLADYEGSFPIATSFGEPRALMSGAIVVMLLATGAWLFRRGSVVGLGIAWFGLTLLPVSHIIPFHELMAEHYLYIPSFGFVLAGGFLWARLAATSRVHRAVALLLLVAVTGALSARTVIRNRDWQTSLSFYTRLTRDNPKTIRGRRGLAETLMKAGLAQAAVRELRQAMALDSNDPRTLLTLGIAVYKIGWRREAERLYRSAIDKRPGYQQALNNLAFLYIEEERFEEAKPLLLEAQESGGKADATVLATIGLLHERQGDTEAAISYYQQALRLRPDREILRKKIAILSAEPVPQARDHDKLGADEAS